MVTVKALFLKLEVLTGKRGIFQTVVDILTSSLLQSNMALRSTFPLPSFLTNRTNTEQKSAYQDYLSLRSCLPLGRHHIFPLCLSLPIMAVQVSQRLSWENTPRVLNITVKALCSHSLERKLSRIILQMVLLICVDLGHPP